MSLSNPTITAAANPAKRSITLRSGKIEEYVRSEVEGEKGHKVELPIPFNFIVLDVTISITGWDDDKKTGIYSNEIKELDEKLVVRSGKDIIAQGTYERIKEKVKAAGGKFTQVVYAAIRNSDKELDLVRINIAGGGLGAWFDYGRGHNVYDGNAVSVSDWKDQKKGRVEFQTPVFARAATPQSVKDDCITMDKQLQDFLIPFLSQQQEQMGAPKAMAAQPSSIPSSEDPDLDDDGLDDIPF